MEEDLHSALSCPDIWGNNDHSSAVPPPPISSSLSSLLPSPQPESLLISPQGNTWIWYGRKRRGRTREEKETGREESISEADTIATGTESTQGGFLHAQKKARGAIGPMTHILYGNNMHKDNISVRPDTFLLEAAHCRALQHLCSAAQYAVCVCSPHLSLISFQSYQVTSYRAVFLLGHGHFPLFM